MTKKGLLISKEMIQEYKSKKVDFKCHTIDENSFIYFTRKKPTNLSSNPNSELIEYEILQKYDECFCIWSYAESPNLQNLRKLFESDWKNKNSLFDDAVLYLYFLFNDNVILTDYDFFYTKLIGAFQIILSITESKNTSNFKSKFGYDVWKKFFIWLHKIEPSVLYSFFLCRYYRAHYSTEIQLEKDLFNDPPQLKMPALYFNSIFLSQDLMFEHIIVNQYREHFIANDPPEILLISLFPFIGLQFNSNTKSNKKKELESYLIKIFKGRINQSSHLSESVIKCYKNQFNKIYQNLGSSKNKNQIKSLNNSHQQYALAIERSKVCSNQAFYQIIPEDDENLLLYGLPYNIYLQNIQEYDIFSEKLLFNNFPLESKGNAQLDQQVQSIISRFELDLQSTDNLKFLITKEGSYQNFFKYENSIIFKYLLKKYSNPQVKIQFEENNSSLETNIFKVYQSIFNLNISLERYHPPLTLFKFKQSLEDYIIYQKNNPIVDVKNKKNTSIQQFNKSTNYIDNSPQTTIQNDEPTLKRSKSDKTSQSHDNIHRSSTDYKNTKQKKTRNVRRNQPEKPITQKKDNILEESDDDDDDNNNENNQKDKESEEEPQNNNQKEETPKKVTKNGKKKARKKSVKVEEPPDKNAQLDFKVSKKLLKSGSTSFNFSDKPPVNQLIFITQSDTPYLFIDSVSNFIIHQYNKFKCYFPLFIRADKFRVFDINYLKLKLQSDKKTVEKDETINNNSSSDDNVDLNTFNEMHIINIIKMALFGILETNFNSVFRDTNLSAQHLLFFFIFYQLEKEKDVIQKIHDKMSIILPHVEKMSELKVEILSKLYFYDKNRTIYDEISKKEENNEKNKEETEKTPKKRKNKKNKDTEDTQNQQEQDEKNKQKESIKLSFNPPPYHYLILSQFKQLFEKNE